MSVFLHKHKNISSVLVGETDPFEELIISWNGIRPKIGFWRFSVRLFQDKWSSWMKFSEWGNGRQSSFHSESEFALTYQDITKAKIGNCTGYEIQVEAFDGANLKHLHMITVCGSILANIHSTLPQNLEAIYLENIPTQSQQILDHVRSKDLCSPTATSAAINFLNRSLKLPADLFAEQVKDKGFDIYGNWVLNTAAAYEHLEGKYISFVQRLPNFQDLHDKLRKGMPVVVSIMGPIEGSARPYANGHLILVTGYDPIHQRVLCMDPAFDSDETTMTSYAIDDFLKAWSGRRKNLSYIFEAVEV